MNMEERCHMAVSPFLWSNYVDRSGPAGRSTRFCGKQPRPHGAKRHEAQHGKKPPFPHPHPLPSSSQNPRILRVLPIRGPGYKRWANRLYVTAFFRSLSYQVRCILSNSPETPPQRRAFPKRGFKSDYEKSPSKGALSLLRIYANSASNASTAASALSPTASIT